MSRSTQTPDHAAYKLAIGQRIAAARADAGLSQRALGVAAGVTQGAIADIELGRCYPSAPTLAALAVELDLSADALLGLDRSRAAMPARVRRDLRAIGEQLAALSDRFAEPGVSVGYPRLVDLDPSAAVDEHALAA